MPEEVDLHTTAALCGVEVVTATRGSSAGPARLHDRWTLSLLEEGEEVLWHRGSLEAASSGHVAVYAPGEVEVVLRRASAPTRRTTVCFDRLPDALSLPNGASPAPPTKPELARAVWNVAELTRSGHRCGDVGSALSTIGAALAAAPAGASSHAEPGAVLRTRRYLQNHASDRVNLRHLAGLAGVSEGHLVRLFHAWVGVPPHTYLLQLRVAAARELLADGVPCGATALQAGFADSSHLTRLFRRILGFTPSQYAKARQVWTTRRLAVPRPTRPQQLAV